MLRAARGFYLLFINCLLAVSLLLGGFQAHAQTVIPLEMWAGKIPSFHATINGRDGLFLLDTGGGISVLDKTFGQRAGCIPWGLLTGFRMRGQRVDFPRCDNLVVSLNGVVLTVETAGILDINGLLNEPPRVDGSLALDIFAGKSVTLDVAARTLTIETSLSLAERTRGATQIAVRAVRDVQGLALSMDVGVATPKGMTWMELDSGNDGAAVIANHVAPLLNLQPDDKTPQPVTLMLGAKLPFKTGAITTNLIMDGNLGEQLFSRWAVTFDLETDKVWLTKSTRLETVRPQ